MDDLIASAISLLPLLPWVLIWGVMAVCAIGPWFRGDDGRRR